MNRPTLAFLAVPALVAVMTSAGCEQKLTQEKFDQLTVGMTDREVEGILRCGGGTDETVGGFNLASSGVSGSGGTDRVYLYKDGDRSVTVTYRDGKAVQFNKSGF
ncbi:MAG TPA: hypothetical protein VFF65_10900 [Phycisphaerales bacterium]|nr:hypothetical protein [Phycisphaerales bacterium]